LEETVETSVRKLFERYERVFNASLHRDVDMDEVAALYASEFIANEPAGLAHLDDGYDRAILVQGDEGLLKSFGWGIWHSISYMQRRSCHFLAARP
jgi:hypothetical protein